MHHLKVEMCHGCMDCLAFLLCQLRGSMPFLTDCFHICHKYNPWGYYVHIISRSKVKGQGYMGRSKIFFYHAHCMAVYIIDWLTSYVAQMQHLRGKELQKSSRWKGQRSKSHRTFISKILAFGNKGVLQKKFCRTMIFPLWAAWIMSICSYGITANLRS